LGLQGIGGRQPQQDRGGGENWRRRKQDWKNMRKRRGLPGRKEKQSPLGEAEMRASIKKKKAQRGMIKLSALVREKERRSRAKLPRSRRESIKRGHFNPPFWGGVNVVSHGAAGGLVMKSKDKKNCANPS